MIFIKNKNWGVKIQSSFTNMTQSVSNFEPKLCFVSKRDDFGIFFFYFNPVLSIIFWITPITEGYGFNLHSEKGKSGQFIGKVDEGRYANRKINGLRH